MRPGGEGVAKMFAIISKKCLQRFSNAGGCFSVCF